MSHWLNVGEGGTGQLNISDGASVDSLVGVLGSWQGSNGTAVVSGVGSAWRTTSVVGWDGSGGLTIQGGAELGESIRDGFIGYAQTGVGVVNVTDAMSTFRSRHLQVGRLGAGELNVLAGGVVSSSGEGYLGNGLTSTGTVNVSGDGALWTIGSTLYVGNRGTGTLNIAHQGRVETGQEIRVGFREGRGDINVSSGGVLDAGDKNLILGYGWTADGNTATGVGSLNITDGGIVSNNIGFLGFGDNATGTARVEGTGSQWNTDQLQVGRHGSGDLEVRSEGTVTARFFNVGGESGGRGNVLVDGSGSRIQVGINADIGAVSSGDLTLRNGGTMTAESAFIGAQAGSSGTMLVTGLGSQLDTSIWTFAGLRGDSDLRVIDGGQVNSQLFMSAEAASSTSQIQVKDAGSRITANDIYLGNSGKSTVDVLAGGQIVANNGMTVGRFAGSESVVNVSGADSRLDVQDTILVGYEGDGTINVANQASLVFGGLSLGAEASGDGDVQVSGVGTQAVGQTVVVGGAGEGDLRLSGQATLDVTNAFFGLRAGGVGLATIESGGHWTTTGEFSVGHEGRGSVEVNSGGVLTTQNAVIGHYRPGSGPADGAVRVDGSNSRWNNQSLGIGKWAIGEMHVTNGGVVNTHLGAYVGEVDSGQGTVNVAGDGSQWSVTNELVVGVAGQGVLSITDGGQVLSGASYIASGSNSAGAVSISGAGSQWQTTGNLFVGGNDSGAGGAGSLVVFDGGLAKGAGVLRNFGQVEIGSGGTVDFANFENFGTLINNGDLKSSLTLKSGGLVQGTGTITGDLLVEAGSVLAPGNSVGQMQAGNTTFSGGGALAFEVINGTGGFGIGWDGLDITGTLTIASTSESPFLLQVSSLSGLSNFSKFNDYSWEFIRTSDGIVGFAADKFSISANGFADGTLASRFSVVASGNSLNLNFSAVPEPGLLLPMSLLTLGALARGRRAKRGEVAAV